MFSLPEQERKQSSCPQGEADGVKCEWPHYGIAHTLGYEGKAPNGSR